MNSTDTSGSVLILNGPNLNMLGRREPEIYGTATLDDIEDACATEAARLGLELEFRQSNHEGELVSWLQNAGSAHDAVIFNPAAYTHTSVALRDATSVCGIPLIEVHLSNIHSREEFRHTSHISPVAKGVICGFGAEGYLMALGAVARLIDGNAHGDSL